MTDAAAGEGWPTAHAALPPLERRILNRARVRILHLRQEMEDLRQAYAEREDLPGLRTLVEALLLIASECERHVEKHARELFERFVDGDVPMEEALEEFRGRIGGIMRPIEDVLPPLLEIARVPHGRDMEALVGPYKTLLGELTNEIGAARELIFEPYVDYGFQLSLLDDLRPLTGSLSEDVRRALASLPRLTIIAYPRQLESETLIHGVIAHELAHIAIDRQVAGEPVARLREIFESAVEACYEELRVEIAADEQLDLEGDDEEEEALQDAIKEAVERLRKWYEEFVCDAVAVYLLGPAFVFALVDLDVASNRWQQLRGTAGVESHPGLAWRVRQLIPHARHYVRDHDRPPWQALAQAIDTIETVVIDLEDAILPAERDLLERALTQLDGELLRRVARPAVFEPENLGQELDLVWDKLCQGIPPAERVRYRTRPDRQGEEGTSSAGTAAPSFQRVLAEWSVPMDWRSVMNGCYIYWTADLALPEVPPGSPRALPAPPGEVDAWLRHNAFVRGTIELIDLHSRLSDMRARMDQLNLVP